MAFRTVLKPRRAVVGDDDLEGVLLVAVRAVGAEPLVDARLVAALTVQQPVDTAQREVREAMLEYRCVPEGLAMTFLTVGLRAAVDIVRHVAAYTVITRARQFATMVVGMTFATGE